MYITFLPSWGKEGIFSMSDIFRLHVYYHVFTTDGDCMVSDSADGDRLLHGLVVQYPDATVIVKDRNAHEVLGGEMPLLRLLQDERGLLTLSLDPRAEDAA